MTADSQKTKTRKRLNHRQKVLLLTLVAVNLCIYGAFAAFILWNQRGSVERSPTMASGQHLELKAARDRARALAVGWQPDVQLVGVTTSWQMASGDRLTLYRPAWSFSFYSPAAGQMQIVAVDMDGALATRQVPVHAAPASVDSDWELDSDELILTFLASGGEDFVRTHSRVNIHFRLAEDSGRSVWYLTGVDPVARQSLTVRVDALSRQIISA
jgi:hypothetical protein